MKTFTGYALIGLLLTTGFGTRLRAQNSAYALPWRMNTAYNLYLMREVHRQYLERREELAAAFSSRKSMVEYRDQKKAQLREIVGDFPGKSALNAQTTARKEGGSFILENIIFESIPGRYVTANLYLPQGEGPFPVALELCGHYPSGKITPDEIRLGQLFTSNGLALMVVDPIGQGERIQFLDEHGRTRTRGSTTEHTLLNAGANLLGSSLAALEFWDNHRAMDYLVSRPDIDGESIGAYGSSGGGTQTCYMLGLDERIKVASVCSYFTKREKVLEIYGPSDGCQHVPYEGREHLEIADFVLMMAPRPVLIMSGKYDFVDFWGATQAFEEVKQAYTVMGSPEKAAMFSLEGGHGMPEPKKLALVTWFKRWLTGDSVLVLDPGQETLELAQLQCTSTGQVLTSLSGSRSIPESQLEQARVLSYNRSRFVEQGHEALIEKVTELLGFTWPETSLQAEQTGSFSMRTYDVRKYQLVREGQMPLPCLVLLPGHMTPGSEVVVYLHDGGKEEILRDDHTVLSYINQHSILILADLRGFGETADPLSLNDTKYWNREYRNAMTSMHVGKPIMGQRVTDIISILDFIEQEPGLRGRNTRLLANGLYGPAAIHAAFLDARIGRTEISRSVKSFLEYLEHPMQRDVYTNVLYGVLQYYDLADLAGLAGEGRIRFVD